MNERPLYIDVLGVLSLFIWCSLSAASSFEYTDDVIERGS